MLQRFAFKHNHSHMNDSSAEIPQKQSVFTKKNLYNVVIEKWSLTSIKSQLTLEDFQITLFLSSLGAKSLCVLSFLDVSKWHYTSCQRKKEIEFAAK